MVFKLSIKRIVFTIIFFLITFFNYVYSMDLSDDVKSTLLEDHKLMKEFRPKYKQYSCKLLTISKIKALYEVEKLDQYYYKIHPEKRSEFLEHIKSKMYNKCMLNYKDDKFIFEAELYYSYPSEGKDNDYKQYINIDLDEAVEEFNSVHNDGNNYNSEYFNKIEKDKDINKKHRKNIENNKKNTFKEDKLENTIDLDNEEKNKFKDNKNDL